LNRLLTLKVIAFLSYLFIIFKFTQNMWLLKTLKRSANWFVHNKASLEPTEALEILLQKLQNWTFIAILSSELQNTIFVLLHFTMSRTDHLGHNQTETPWINAAKNFYGVCQRQQLWRCFSLSRKTFISTVLGCGGIFSDNVITNFLLNLTVKEFWKSVNIWRS